MTRTPKIDRELQQNHNRTHNAIEHKKTRKPVGPLSKSGGRFLRTRESEKHSQQLTTEPEQTTSEDNSGTLPGRARPCSVPLDTTVVENEMTPAAFRPPDGWCDADDTVSVQPDLPAGVGLLHEVQRVGVTAAARAQQGCRPRMGLIAGHVESRRLKAVGKVVHRFVPDARTTTVHLRKQIAYSTEPVSQGVS